MPPSILHPENVLCADAQGVACGLLLIFEGLIYPMAGLIRSPFSFTHGRGMAHGKARSSLEMTLAILPRHIVLHKSEFQELM